MKKIFSYLITILTLISCSSDNNTDNDTDIPSAPLNLTGSITSTNQVNLSWVDNSDNEIGFKIERKTVGNQYIFIGKVSSNVSTFEDNNIMPETTYFYRVYAYDSDGNPSNYSNEFNLTTNTQITLPTLATKPSLLVTDATASCGGYISTDGGAEITAKGVVWSTEVNPTVALNTKTNDGVGIGAFTSAITGLTANTTYYAKAYATNSAGTAYGNQISFRTNPTPVSITDIDGNTYQTITICNQTWTKTNLNVSRYRNGDVIPQVTDPSQWTTLTTGAWCYYANTTSNGTIYGKLYNWYAVNDPRGLAPEGYHIPSEEEWTTLMNCLGGANVAGGKMKEAGTAHWISPNTGATNSSGFTGLPGGSFDPVNARFSSMGSNTSWWGTTNSVIHSGSAFICGLQYDFNFAVNIINPKYYFISVRCVKD